MTSSHHLGYCASCQRPFYSERDGTFCAACVMLAYEQASFTGTERLTTFEPPANFDFQQFNADHTKLIVDYFMNSAYRVPYPDDATPTQRLDTDGGDDA